MHLTWFAVQEIRSSYWSEITGLLLAGAFSLSKVHVTWLSYSDISGKRVVAVSSTAMGFGQLAALFFLALPCFTALEAFYGMIT